MKIFMANKPIRFSVFQLIITSDAPFSLESFSSIEAEKMETFEVTHSKEEKEVLEIKRVYKECYEDRFITFYFNEGNKFPYSPTVIDATDLQEKENPRPAEDIELGEQFFVVIDINTQRVYLSDQRKKTTFGTWLKDKINKEVIIKSIISEEDFLSKIKSVSKISFCLVPNLFNSSTQDILSHNLTNDIFGFEAEKARLELEYNNSNMTERIKNKFSEILRRKNEFQEITIIGRSDEGFESIFNLEEVVSKLIIDVPIREETNLLEPSLVFNLLTSKIKSI